MPRVNEKAGAAPSPLRACARVLVWGAALGLLAFLVETSALLSAQLVGVGMDLSGPYAELVATVEPLLPGLFARLLLVYLGAGAVLGLVAAGLAAIWGSRKAWALVAYWWVLVLWLAWAKAISRPALFDDVSFLQPLLTWLVNRGEPWQPQVAAGLFLGGHGWVWMWRSPRPRWQKAAGLTLAALWMALFTLRADDARAPRGPPFDQLRVNEGPFMVSPVEPWALRGPPFDQLRVNEGPFMVSAVEPWAPRGPPFDQLRVNGAFDSAQDERGEPAPLVVLLGVDAFRPDRLQALGETRHVAPHLDALVADSTLFTRAYTPIAQTEPAWRSLLTAQWPSRTGVRYPLTAESRIALLPTFAQRFSEAGYRTVFATDCSRFHYEGPLSGFTTRLQPPRGAINFLLEKLRYRGVGLVADNAVGAWILPEWVDNRALAGLHNPQAYASRLAQRLEAEAGKGPTLFAFHATAAHFPGDPVYPHYRRFVSPTEPLARRLRMHFSPIAAKAQGGWNREGAEALYDELLSQADEQVGQLIAVLKKSGRYDDALIVAFSDHGESFHSDHPELAGATPVHGARLSEEENRILLAVKLPRGQGRPGTQVDALVRLLDIGPTLLAAQGLSPLPEVEGQSLLPLLQGKPFQEKLLYAETGFTHASPEVFDAEHARGAPRSFEAYRVRPDGVAEFAERLHVAALREKDTGVFDGRSWLRDQPRADGTMKRSCQGPCDNPALSPFLDQMAQRSEP